MGEHDAVGWGWVVGRGRELCWLGCRLRLVVIAAFVLGILGWLHDLRLAMIADLVLGILDLFRGLLDL